MWNVMFAARLAIAAMAVGLAFFAVNERPAVAGVEPTFAIDADPSGTPCSPVDASRVVNPGDSVTVALCLLNADLDPINGGLTNITTNISYTSPLAATDNAGDADTGLGGNPNWNAAGLGGAGAWDCNQLNSPPAAPNASPSPATITCATNSLENQAVPATAYLALLTFNNAGSPGTSDITWDSTTNALSGFNEVFCDVDIVCVDAQITVTGTGSTATPVGPTNTATATSTPCSVNGATCTPVTQDRNTITPTPSLVVDETPPAGETPVPGDPTDPGAPGGQIPGGGPGGVITLPDTGSGGVPTANRTNTLATAVLSLLAASSLAMGLRTSRRAVHERRTT